MNYSLSNATVNGSGTTNDSNLPTTPSEIFVEPAPMRWTLRMIFILVFLVGMIGNSVVCAAVIRRKRMRTSNNIFTFNLAFSDLLTVVIYVPSQMTAFENNHNWLLGNFACHVTYITIPMCMSASILTLLAITLDRYRAIANPMQPRLTLKTVKIILASIWVTSVLVVLPLVFVAGEVSPTPDTVYCDETWPEGPYSQIYWLFIFGIQYVLPLMIIVVLAVLIGLKIRQNSAEMLRSSNQVVAAVRQRMRQTSKITNMLIALVILYAVCMLPQHVVYFWLTYGNLRQSKYFVYVLRFSNVFPMANSAFNPFAYGLNKEFKQAFQSFFKCEYNKPESPLVNGVTFHRTARRKFQHNAIYGEETLLQRWRRKSSATSLFGKSEKTSLWKNKRWKREKNRNKWNGAALQDVPLCNGGDAGQNVSLRKVKKTLSGTYPEGEGMDVEKPANGVVSVTLETSFEKRGEKCSPNRSEKSVCDKVGEQASYQDETTSLLSNYEVYQGTGMFDIQHRPQERDKSFDTMLENFDTKPPDGPRVYPKASDSLLADSSIGSCLKSTMNKPDEELMKFIQSLEETNV